MYMTELIIESVPSGAEVQIDGAFIGTTPIIIPIEIGLEAFRTECLSDGGVICSWDVLKTRLEDQTVSRIWWDLTRDERYSISEMAVKNTLFYTATRGRSGKFDCVGGEGDTREIVCIQNSIIRYIKFTSKSFGISDKCYYRRIESSEEFCYVPNESYGLPGHIVSCSTPIDYTGEPFGHSMCAIQTGLDLSKLDSWIVFQYTDFNIKPGDLQMPVDTYVRFKIPDNSTSCNGYGSHTVAEFFI